MGMSVILYSVMAEAISCILLVTFSGAGAPLDRLYLMPKSSLGPWTGTTGPGQFLAGTLGVEGGGGKQLTTGVVAGGQQDAASGTALADEVASGRRTQDGVAANKELAHAVGGGHLGNQLHHLGVVVTAIAGHHQEGALGALGDGLQDCRDEVLGIVLLLEDDHLLAQAGAGWMSAMPVWMDGGLTFQVSAHLLPESSSISSTKTQTQTQTPQQRQRTVGLRRDGGDGHGGGSLRGIAKQTLEDRS